MANKKESTYPRQFPIAPDPLGKDKLDRILKNELKQWRIVESPLPEDPFIKRTELFRTFKFDDFDLVIDFMQKVGIACNLFPHHPRWENVWTSLKVWLSTWDSEHIISYKDIMLARHMESMFESFGPPREETHTEKRIQQEQKSFVQKMKNLIAKDELEEAFGHINTYIAVNTEKAVNNELILLNRRYNRNRKVERGRTQPTEEIDRELNKISKDLLESLEEI